MSKNRIARSVVGAGMLLFVVSICQASLYRSTAQNSSSELSSTGYLAVAGHAEWANACYASRANAVDYYQDGVLNSTINLTDKTYYDLGVMGSYGGQFWACYDGGIDRVYTSGTVRSIVTGSYNAVAGSTVPDHALAARATGGIDVIRYSGGVRTENALPDITFVDLSGNSDYPDWFFGVSDDGGIYKIVVRDFNATNFAHRLVANNGYTAVAADSAYPEYVFALRDGAVDRINVETNSVTPWLTGDFTDVGRFSPGPQWTTNFYAVVPEPMTMCLMGLGMTGMLIRRKK